MLLLEAVTITVPLLLPLMGDTLNQSTLSMAAQLVFEFIVNEAVLPELPSRLRLLVETVRTGKGD